MTTEIKLLLMTRYLSYVVSKGKLPRVSKKRQARSSRHRFADEMINQLFLLTLSSRIKIYCLFSSSFSSYIANHNDNVVVQHPPLHHSDPEWNQDLDSPRGAGVSTGVLQALRRITLLLDSIPYDYTKIDISKK